MIFKNWIRQFEKDNSPIGDLARDIKQDKQFPSSIYYKPMLRYLETCNACSDALETFKEAYEIYKAK